MSDKLGKYTLVKEVGKGSTGTVYLSHDPFYGRDVAVKVYENEPANEEEARVTRKMFFNEANMVGMLHHPNIMPIYDAGEEGGRYYVVTEFIHGARTLRTYCNPENLLRIDDVIGIVFKVAKALHYAHSRGVIHRDIKPSNVMMTHDNDVRIIDFGIALLSNSDASQIRGIAGSPSYMSPEQVEGGDVTQRSDLYSLGTVMYELLAGVRPYRAPNLAKLLHQIVYSTPAPLGSLRDDIPQILEDIVTKLLTKKPENRFKSGRDLAAALTRAFQQLRKDDDAINKQERFERLRSLEFFHDFSHAEIWEVLRASDWRSYAVGQEIVREGEMDDRFYIIVDGDVKVVRGERIVGAMHRGACFGESSYVTEARRTATIRAGDNKVTLLRVSSTLLEQVSTACQLHFTKVFLRSLIERLQSVERAQRVEDLHALTATATI